MNPYIEIIQGQFLQTDHRVGKVVDNTRVAYIKNVDSDENIIDLIILGKVPEEVSIRGYHQDKRVYLNATIPDFRASSGNASGEAENEDPVFYEHQVVKTIEDLPSIFQSHAKDLLGKLAVK
jgi:hypothetical protein